MMPGIRTGFRGTRIPSEDGDQVVAVDISHSMNLSAGSDVLGIDLKKMKTGEIKSGKKVFRLEQAGNRLVAAGTFGKDRNLLPNTVKNIKINEDVSSLIFLHACAKPSANQKAYFNIPDFFDSADLLGWYEIIYEDGFK